VRVPDRPALNICIGYETADDDLGLNERFRVAAHLGSIASAHRSHSLGSTEAFVYIAYEVNSMGTISTRVPDELEVELEAYLEDEKLDRSTAVRKLLSEGLEEWRRERALDQLAAGTVTFSKAAELAGMSVWDFAQLAKERDLTWVADDHLDADLEAL
jgi:predicted HTH domain antitoxin